MISKIENGRAVPSLNILYRIAEALDLTVGQLFEKPAEPNGLLSRAGERPIVKIDPLRSGPGLTLERLIPYDKSRLLQGSIHNIAPGGGTDGLITHEGEEVAYVLEGKVEFSDRRSAASCSMPAIRSAIAPNSRTAITNGGDSAARMIIVNTPPSSDPGTDGVIALHSSRLNVSSRRLQPRQRSCPPTRRRRAT